MKKFVISAAVASVAALSFGTAAHAAGPAGTWTADPATGTDLLAPKVNTSAGCPTDSDAYNAILSGPGAFASGYAITPTQDPSFSTTQGFPVQLGLSFADAATELGTTIVAGEYPLVVNCVDSFSLEVKATFTGTFYFTSPTSYTTTDPNASTPSTTTLAVSPSGPVDAGASVTLTATIDPATAAGTVQFKDGSANLGAAVAVSGGKAVLTTSALTAGSHSITAVFSSSTAGVSGSASTASTVVVNAPQAVATTTALSVSPSGPVEQYTAVTLAATVTPSAAAGKVQFTDGGQNIGAPVTVSGGAATLTTSSLGAGDHAFTARFVPANSGAYTGSESPAVNLNVKPFAGANASQTISTTVESGALTISVASNDAVVLPNPALTSDASKLTTGGTLNQLTVTDTRAGNLGWNVAGQVSDFKDGSGHEINAANLGWTPKVVDKADVQTVTAGAKVDPANAIAPGASAPSGNGLASSRTLATAAAGAGVGTAHLNADVALQAPTSTVAGTYSATLTITAI
ncbi:Ig-like domain repeat protein [Actinoplanes sp. CA-131856]